MAHFSWFLHTVQGVDSLFCYENSVVPEGLLKHYPCSCEFDFALLLKISCLYLDLCLHSLFYFMIYLSVLMTVLLFWILYEWFLKSGLCLHFYRVVLAVLNSLAFLYKNLYVWWFFMKEVKIGDINSLYKMFLLLCFGLPL